MNENLTSRLSKRLRRPAIAIVTLGSFALPVACANAKHVRGEGSVSLGGSGVFDFANGTDFSRGLAC